MRIAMVSVQASLAADDQDSGAGVHVADLATVLAADGHDVTVHTRRDDPDLPEETRTPEGVLVRHMDVGPPRPTTDDELLQLMPALATGLSDAWECARPDVVHAHTWLSGLAVLAAARGTDVPVVESFHSLAAADGAEDPPDDGRVRLERGIAHGVSHLVASSTAQVLDLVRMGVDRRRVSAVPWGVDVDLFRPVGPVAPRADRPRLLHVGPLAPHKGADDVVRALRTVPDAELVLAGGPQPDALDADPDVARLRALAEDQGVADRVDLRGWVPRSELPALMRSADLFVDVPHDEGFGTSALEAMAAGLPAVASSGGGLGDTVVDGSTGVLVPHADPDALSYVLRRILRDPVRREGFGVAGVDRARSRYAWPRIAADLCGVYGRLVPGLAEEPEPEPQDEDLHASLATGA